MRRRCCGWLIQLAKNVSAGSGVAFTGFRGAGTNDLLESAGTSHDGSFSGHTTPSPRLLVARPEEPTLRKPGDVNPFAPMTSPAEEGQVEVRRQASAATD